MRAEEQACYEWLGGHYLVLQLLALLVTKRELRVELRDLPFGRILDVELV